jgi:hypothetical protein
MEEAPQPRPLGLDRLSPEGFRLFQQFIQAKAEEHSLEPFIEELQGMPERDLEGARTKITALARGGRAEREMACRAIPYLTAKDPDFGFPLWHKLAVSGDIEEEKVLDVSKAATQAAIDTWGMLGLDPERVVKIMRAACP